MRFETAPGRQLQNDWAKLRTVVAGREQEVHFAVNTLGYSRRFHFVAMECEDAEHTYESLILSFEYLGGVTAEVLGDNQKTEVISHRAGVAVEFNPRFVELAAHYDFSPHACRPRRARTKGKDERMVRYIKENFFVRYREFESLSGPRPRLRLREKRVPLDFQRQSSRSTQKHTSRFAVPRCWSGGDSNHRSSLAFSPLEKVSKSGRFFWPEFAARSLGEGRELRGPMANRAQPGSTMVHNPCAERESYGLLHEDTVH